VEPDEVVTFYVPIILTMLINCGLQKQNVGLQTYEGTWSSCSK